MNFNPFKKKEEYNFEEEELNSLSDLNPQEEKEEFSPPPKSLEEDDFSEENTSKLTSQTTQMEESSLDLNTGSELNEVAPAQNFDNSQKITELPSLKSSAGDELMVETLKVQLDRIEKKLNLANENFKTLDFKSDIIIKMVKEEVSLETRKKIEFKMANK